jgi:hypothetical protein
MKRCPKCGRYQLVYDPRTDEYECYWRDCWWKGDLYEVLFEENKRLENLENDHKFMQFRNSLGPQDNHPSSSKKDYFKKSRPLTDKEMDNFKMSKEEKQEANLVNNRTYKSVSKKELSRYKKLQSEFKKAQAKWKQSRGRSSD